jgi:hypothetical protein
MTEVATVVQRLRELEAKATPAPWEWGMGGWLYSKSLAESVVESSITKGGAESVVVTGNADKRLIEEMRNALPALLDTITTLLAERDELHQRSLERDWRIMELTAECDELRRALRPLAKLHHDRLDRMSDDAPIYQHADAEVTVGDIRKARAALAKGVRDGQPRT